jgi:hypothetical protein
MQTFVHTFKSPVNEYTALAVINGMNPAPVMIYQGRQCYVAASVRKRSAVGRRYFNCYTVRFLDGDGASIPAGEFNSKARVAPIPAELAS